MAADSPAVRDEPELLQRLVAVFNGCARSGDFSACSELFADDAVMEFEGVPDWGPFEGRTAIMERLASDPPDDEMRITKWRDDGKRIRAQFVWSDIPDGRGGTLVVEPRGGQIAQLIIAFGGPDARM